MRTAILSTFSIPDGCCLFPTLLSRAKAGNCGSMNALTSRLHREGDKEQITPRSTCGYLSNKFKNGQQFFTQDVNH